MLIKEYDVKIQKLLITGKKKREELVQEFVLAIKEVGSKADIEEEY